MALIRLDKCVAHLTGLTRSEAVRLIRRGGVVIMGECKTDPALKIPADTALVIDDVDYDAADQDKTHTYIFHKPEGCICANKDKNHPVVLDYFAGVPGRDQLHCAGRLDLDASGLVIVTSDGKLNHAITAPRRQIKKLYQVETDCPIPSDAAAKFAAGIKHPLERTVYAEALLEITGLTTALVTVSEGRYHEVKRRFEAVGCQVTALKRLKIGALALGDDLEPGDFRELDAAEIEQIFAD